MVPARTREVVVGKSVASAFPTRKSARRLHFGRGDWDVVGVMDAGRGAQNSEIWGDLNQVSFRLAAPCQVSAPPWSRATDAVTAKALINDINNDQRLNMNAHIREGILRRANLIRRAHRVYRIFRVDHHGRRQQFRRDEHDVRRGGAPARARSARCASWASRGAAS